MKRLETDLLVRYYFSNIIRLLGFCINQEEEYVCLFVNIFVITVMSHTAS